jgi:hypothetical protein
MPTSAVTFNRNNRLNQCSQPLTQLCPLGYGEGQHRGAHHHQPLVTLARWNPPAALVNLLVCSNAEADTHNQSRHASQQIDSDAVVWLACLVSPGVQPRLGSTIVSLAVPVPGGCTAECH